MLAIRRLRPSRYRPRMVRKKQTGAINLKMYQHFAVVTVLLTVTLAFFSDGENREAAAKAASSYTATKKKEPQGNKPILILKNDPGGNQAALSGFYQEADVPTGSGGDGSGIIPGEAPGRGRGIDWERLRKLGITPDMFAKMSPAEQEQLRTMLNGGVSRAQREQMIKQGTAAAAKRAGNEAQNNDF